MTTKNSVKKQKKSSREKIKDLSPKKPVRGGSGVVPNTKKISGGKTGEITTDVISPVISPNI